MKKIIYTIFLLLIFPFSVKAANYKIANQLIEAQILTNGDLKVTELIVMDGTFNGYEKTLEYGNSLVNDSSYIYDASGLELIDIKAKYVNKVSFEAMNDQDFEDFTEVSYATNGDKAKYTTNRGYYGNTYRLYYPAHNQKVAFLITYKLNRVVVMHQDFAELYWNFITPNGYDDINDVQIKVLLPAADNSNYFRLWAHGDLSGEINKNASNDGVIATISYMDKNAVLDIRLTFDGDLITDKSNIKTSNETLEDILEVEEERARVANQLRETLKKKRNTTIALTISLYVIMIGGGIGIYFKYGKSPKSGYYSKYNREFIDDYNVEVIDYLMNRKITPNAMSASIMNLVYKKNIKVEEIASSNSKKKQYLFILDNTLNINDSEQILIDFLFDKVGKGAKNANEQKIFSTLDLKNYASGTKTCSTFINSYTKWKNDIIQKGVAEKFYETSGVPKVIGVVVMILCSLVFTYGASNGVDFPLTSLLMIAGFIFMIFTIVLYKKTAKGSLHYDKWKAFKNFLDDFGSFELKELPEIVLWERYLVYATVFGLADKVQKSMNVRIKEIDTSMASDIYIPSYIYFDLGNTLSSSVNNALSSAYNRQAANYANTHSSSSSGGGFGGGFSSGGGFGGGGSSGHGF